MDPRRPSRPLELNRKRPNDESPTSKAPAAKMQKSSTDTPMTALNLAATTNNAQPGNVQHTVSNHPGSHVVRALNALLDHMGEVASLQIHYSQFEAISKRLRKEYDLVVKQASQYPLIAEQKHKALQIAERETQSKLAALAQSRSLQEGLVGAFVAAITDTWQTPGDQHPSSLLEDKFATKADIDSLVEKYDKWVSMTNESSSAITELITTQTQSNSTSVAQLSEISHRLKQLEVNVATPRESISESTWKTRYEALEKRLEAIEILQQKSTNTNSEETEQLIMKQVTDIAEPLVSECRDDYVQLETRLEDKLHDMTEQLNTLREAVEVYRRDSSSIVAKLNPPPETAVAKNPDQSVQVHSSTAHNSLVTQMYALQQKTDQQTEAIRGIQHQYDNLFTNEIVMAMVHQVGQMYPDLRNAQTITSMIGKLRTDLSAARSELAQLRDAQTGSAKAQEEYEHTQKEIGALIGRQQGKLRMLEEHLIQRHQTGT